MKIKAMTLALILLFVSTIIALAVVLTPVKVASAKNYDIEYEYLTLDKSVISSQGGYDNWYEIRIYPRGGGTIKRRSGESNVLGQDGEIDFYPGEIRLVATAPSNDSIARDRKAAVFKTYKYGNQNITYDDYAYLYKDTSTYITGSSSFFSGCTTIKEINRVGHIGNIGMISSSSKSLDIYSISQDGSYRLKMSFTSVQINNNETVYYGDGSVAINIEFRFTINTDKPGNLNISMTDKAVFSGNTYYLKNTIVPSDVVVSTSVPNNYAGMYYTINYGEHLYDDNIKAMKLGKNMRGIIVYYDWTGYKSRTLPYIVYDTNTPNIENGASFNHWFSDSSLSGKLGALSENRAKSFDIGITKDSVSFQFESGVTEAPESAVYSFAPMTLDDSGKPVISENNTIQNADYTNKAILSESGKYSVTVTDLAGNYTRYNFIIHKIASEYNHKIIMEQGYISSQNHEVNLPAGYTNVMLGKHSKYENNVHKYPGQYTIGKKYLFVSYENALQFAMDIEVEKAVVRTSTGYVYKLISNPNATYEYTVPSELYAAVEHFSRRFVKQNTTAKLKENVYIEKNAVQVMDKTLLQNTAENTAISYKNKPVFMVGKDFKFVKNRLKDTAEKEAWAGAYDIQTVEIFGTEQNEQGREFALGNAFIKTISGLLGANEGIFRVVETAGCAASFEYYIYYDQSPPLIYVTYSEVGSEEETSRTVTQNDVLSLYLSTFEITGISDSPALKKGNFFVQIQSQTNAEVSGIYYENFPMLKGDESGKGAGKYTITVYDRTGNNFSFELHLYGKPPKVGYSAYGIGSERKLVATITGGESYNAILGLEIYRNNESLGSHYQNGEEWVEISPNIRSYEFLAGGIYYFKIMDNFGRVTTTSEYKFTKNMPVINLAGVKENEKTKYDITASFDIACKFVLRHDGNIISPTVTKDETLGLQYVYIKSSQESSGSYAIKVWYETDTANYNEVKFVLYAVPPRVEFRTKSGKVLGDGEATSETVFLSWNVTQIISSALYTFNAGYATRYNLGTKDELKKSGTYVFTIKDDLGNILSFTFVIDRTVSYSVTADEGNGKLIYNGEKDGKTLYTVKNKFSINALENGLLIEIYKDGHLTEFTFESAISETGLFYVVMQDSFLNAEAFYVEIDITPPQAEIEGVGSDDRTRHDVKVTLASTADVFEVKLYINNKLQSNVYIAAEYLFLETGKFKLELYDRAGNSIVFTFEIDKVIDFSSSVISGAVTNEPVKIVLNEKGSVTFYKSDDESVVALDGGYIKLEGKYKAVIADEIGNSKVIVFTIDKSIKNKEYEYPVPQDCVIDKVKKDGKEYSDYKFSNNQAVFSEDGKYELHIKNDVQTSKHTFVIDTVPPTVQLSGVGDGETTTNDISFSSFNKSSIKMKLYLNDNEIDVNKSSVLKENGTYRLVLTDEAGNSTEYTFTKVYVINGFGVLFIVFGVVILILVGLIILKLKFKSKVR